MVFGFDFVLVMFVCYHLFRVRARCVLVVLVSSLCFGFWFLFCVGDVGLFSFVSCSCSTSYSCRLIGSREPMADTSKVITDNLDSDGPARI